MEIKTHKTKVLYIAGDARSGSTLLELLLGESRAYFSAGELCHFWRHAFLENLLCACGKSFRECEFWNAVVARSFGGWEAVDAQAIKELWLSMSRLRYFPRMALPGLRQSPVFQERFKILSPIWENLYSSIQQVSGAQVVIDASKWPVSVFTLNALPGIDLYIVHLVRDSRAVAYSAQRKKVQPEVTSGKRCTPVLSPLRSAIFWNTTNWVAEQLRQITPRYLFLRYEDFVKRPQETLLRVAEFVQEAVDLDFFIDSHTVLLGVNHTVAGNPHRFNFGKTRITLDTEWKDGMPQGDRRLVTALTFPLLRRYGYWGE